MALVTRCSNAACLTLFRVTPAQLQAFGGQVRCGTCGTVFDAFPSLATVADAALRAPDAAVPDVQPVPEPQPPTSLDDPRAEHVVEWVSETRRAPDDSHDQRAVEPVEDARRLEASGASGPEEANAPGGEFEREQSVDRADPVQVEPAEQSFRQGESAATSESRDQVAPVGQVEPQPPVESAEQAELPEPGEPMQPVGTATSYIQNEPVEPSQAAGLELAEHVEPAEQQAGARATPGPGEAPPAGLERVELTDAAGSVEPTDPPGSFVLPPPFDPVDDVRMPQRLSAAGASLERIQAGSLQSHPAPAQHAEPEESVGSAHWRHENVLAGDEGRDAVAARDTQQPPENAAAELDVQPSAAQAVDAEPVPAFAPELTDYSVTPGPPLRPHAVNSRRWLARLGLLVLIIAAVAGAAWFFRDRLPAPLDAWLARFPRAEPSPLPMRLLREYGFVLWAAVALVVFALLRRHRTAWIALAVVLTLLLSGQFLYAYRTQVAAWAPATRPALERLCTLIGCEVGLPTAPSQLVIEASDLQALDAARPNLIQLSATVRNRASIDVAFPAIEVTLTDAQDKAVARRVLMPEQYLERKPDNRVGLPAGGEFSVRLTLDTTELRPVGYRLYLFYP